jgi:hypothetical protein
MTFWKLALLRLTPFKASLNVTFCALAIAFNWQQALAVAVLPCF